MSLAKRLNSATSDYDYSSFMQENARLVRCVETGGVTGNEQGDAA
jgi:hypothetical protein